MYLVFIFPLSASWCNYQWRIEAFSRGVNWFLLLLLINDFFILPYVILGVVTAFIGIRAESKGPMLLIEPLNPSWHPLRNQWLIFYKAYLRLTLVDSPHWQNICIFLFILWVFIWKLMKLLIFYLKNRAFLRRSLRDLLLFKFLL